MHDVKHNDVFVLGTDGLWDNLYPSMILDLMRPFVRRGDDLVDCDLIAEIICNEAEKLSKDPGFVSPFAKKAYNYHQDYLGGKEDDITVVIA